MPTRCIHNDGRDPREVTSHVEIHRDRTAFDRSVRLTNHHLKPLRTLMGSAVKLRGAQQGNVVLLADILHELGNKLLGWKAAQGAVLRRHHDIKPSLRGREFALVLEPKKSARNGAAVTTECRDDILGCEMVLTSLKKSLDVSCDCSHRLPFVRSTYHNVSASANNKQEDC